MSGRSVSAPYTSARSVTKSDSTIIAATRGIMAAVTGDLAVVFPDSTAVTFTSIVAGQIYPISVIKVMSTGTTATGIVALY
jgi:hypothetical protein